MALAGAAAGLGRVQGGPVGKTERCLLLTLLAFAGSPVVLLTVLAAGSLLTAAVRLARLARLARVVRLAPVVRLGGVAAGARSAAGGRS